MGYIGKSHLFADICDCPVCLHKKPLSMDDADVIDILDYGAVCVALKLPA